MLIWLRVPQIRRCLLVNNLYKIETTLTKIQSTIYSYLLHSLYSSLAILFVYLQTFIDARHVHRYLGSRLCPRHKLDI